MTLKRKYEATQNELDCMRELYVHLRTRPEAEVTQILHRIQSAPDAFEVLRFIQQGSLLLQLGTRSQDADPRMRVIDADALANSRIKVHTAPWTTVAGDGIVSHLLTLAFDREQPFILPFLDEKTVLADMALDDVANAKFCSPLLVNAMCAFAAVSTKSLDKLEKWSLTA